MTFRSQISKVCDVQFPRFTGVRVLMMPFHVHDPLGSLPNGLHGYVRLIEDVLQGMNATGVGYLTVDEAELHAGEYHRRPGKHVDGIGPDGRSAAVWGGGGGYAASGMYLAANAVGCRSWVGHQEGEPGPDGDCAHITPSGTEIVLGADQAYWCNSMALHEALPMTADTRRQFVRISMPNDCPWHEGCTPNPLGIKPTGPIASERTAFLNYRR